MTKRMLIDATHAEETRVVVLDGNRLEDFDVETSSKRQLKGNIYLAKVVRVEPSLQAAFVEYGGNRHGFLAFSEIHPDYYQIPIADRQRLIEQEAEDARREEEEAERELDDEPGDEPSDPGQAEQVAAQSEIATERREAEESWASGESEAEPAFRLHGAATETPYEAPREHGADPSSPVEALAPPEPSDSVSAASAAAPMGDVAVATDELPASVPVDHVAGGIAMSPTDVAPEPPVSLAAADLLPADFTQADIATVPPDSAPPAEPTAAAEVPQDIAPPLDTMATETQAESPAPASPTAAAASSEHAEPPALDEHQPDHPARRAQPLIVDTETLSGPVETGPDSDESDALTAPAPMAVDTGAIDTGDIDTGALDPSAIDIEHDPDLIEDDPDAIPESPPPETVGGEPDAVDEPRERRLPARFLRNYKIQEVIRRRQILLVQVVKEERGTKGAALTTYISLAGRFSVLMPNSPRGGGISRKITSATDRRRLKEVVAELDMPKGMGLIVRTAGANRPKPEIKRDCEYLLRLWDDIRDHTMKSVAPALIYEEAALIKRAIRDVYSRDIEEILVDGEDGWRSAHEFMRMLMPSHAKKVQLWREIAAPGGQPLFSKYQVESQLDGMLQPTVQLRSGGYLVINQTEALVAIDVNSGRSTRERNVEETALRTNLEAADEVARQLRLRDLAGLIVIDFIDMEAKRHNAMVERRLKEALKNDRARIQVGHISHFGLMEMSRQRLRPSLTEASFILCPHCGGTGHVRSTENAAIHVLRGIEDEGSKRRAAEIVVHAATPIALYILNHKRERLSEIEHRYAMRVTVMCDDTQVSSQFRIDRVRAQVAREDALAAITPDAPHTAYPTPRFEPEEADQPFEEDEAEPEDLAGAEAGADEAGEETDEDEAGSELAQGEANGGSADQGERRRRRRRRRRGGRREEAASPASDEPAAADGLGESGPPEAADDFQPTQEQAAAEEDATAADMHIEGVPEHAEGVPEHAEPMGEDDPRRRRGRRGGRRRRREPDDGEASPFAAPGAEQPDLPPVYIGPTPANPFGGQAFDIFDVLEQVEASSSARSEPTLPSPPQSHDPVGPNAADKADLLFEPETGADAHSWVQPDAADEPDAATEAAAEPRGVVEPHVTTTAYAETKPTKAEVTAPIVEPEEARWPSEVEAVAEPAAGPHAEAEPPAEQIAEAMSPPPAPAETLGDAPIAEAAPVESPAEPPVEPPVEAPVEPPAGYDASPLPPPEVANDAAPEPAVRPIIIGSGTELPQKRRGWWRR